MYVMFLYVYEIVYSCGKHVSSPLSFRELRDSPLGEMDEDKFLYETETDVSMYAFFSSYFFIDSVLYWLFWAWISERV